MGRLHSTSGRQSLVLNDASPRVLMIDGLVLVTVGSAVLLRHSRTGVTSL